MASNQPLVSGSVTLKTQTSNVDRPKKRRVRRARSAPLAHFVPTDANGDDDALLRSESIFGRLNPTLKKVALSLTVIVYMGLGTICFYTIRNQIKGKKTNAILDALYFCVVTMTTVGYGDLVPNSNLAKLLACAFVFTGMVLIGLILAKAADYLVEKQEKLLFRALHMYKIDGEIEVLKEVEHNRFYTTSILLVVFVVTGTIFLYKVEKLDLVDAFYCVCSTITTLGYGDISFSSKGGRVFAVFWILTVAFILCRAAEFVLFKLKEMGKICKQDISVIMEEFEELDLDQSGTLTVSDIALAQSVETRSS
ncbi:hypothetical protein GOBAR_AA21563 [Gossypium barbadense]|uniref:Potassium channel domain-containing protein n=1 Tax=Gossypium barbadense TaxID=3634 RepID=A0A2P5X6Z6_GOSBA|nr:hypothetical protein GOBAR_AA21563 [Gossypium barbadense]